MFGLGDPDGGIEVVFGQGGIEDFVAVVIQVGRFEAARRRLPVVQEEEFHGDIVAHPVRLGQHVHTLAIRLGWTASCEVQQGLSCLAATSCCATRACVAETGCTYPRWVIRC